MSSAEFSLNISRKCGGFLIPHWIKFTLTLKEQTSSPEGDILFLHDPVWADFGLSAAEIRKSVSARSFLNKLNMKRMHNWEFWRGFVSKETFHQSLTIPACCSSFNLKSDKHNHHLYLLACQGPELMVWQNDSKLKDDDAATLKRQMINLASHMAPASGIIRALECTAADSAEGPAARWRHRASVFEMPKIICGSVSRYVPHWCNVLQMV